MYDSLEVTKVENKVVNHHLSCPHAQMKPNNCFPPASQLYFFFSFNFKFTMYRYLVISYDNDLVRSRGREGWFKLGSRRPLISKKFLSWKICFLSLFHSLDPQLHLFESQFKTSHDLVEFLPVFVVKESGVQDLALSSVNYWPLFFPFIRDALSMGSEFRFWVYLKTSQSPWWPLVDFHQFLWTDY